MEQEQEVAASVLPDELVNLLMWAKPAWPLLLQALVLWYLGNIFKRRVWTRARAKKGGVYAWMRDTLPMHPVAAGGIWGAFWPFTPAVDWVTTRGSAIGWGMLAGVVSVWGFDLLKRLAENRGWTWLAAALSDPSPRDSVVPSAPTKEETDA